MCKWDYEREYELVLKEACHIPRVSRNKNLRADYLEETPEEPQFQASPCRKNRRTAQNASKAPGTGSLVSSPSVAVHQETLDILEGLRTTQDYPLLTMPRITHNKDRSNRHARIFGELIRKANDAAETCSPKPCISVPSPLYPPHRNISSGTVASSLGSPTSIRYLISTELNPPNKHPQRAHTPDTPQLPLLEYLNTSRTTTDLPNSFDSLSSFDGGKCAREYVEYIKRASNHSQWTSEPDQIDHSPPTPVLRRASSWVMGRLRRGSVHVAHALGLQSQPGVLVGADRCYQIYCSLPSCNPGHQR